MTDWLKCKLFRILLYYKRLKFLYLRNRYYNKVLLYKDLIVKFSWKARFISFSYMDEFFHKNSYKHTKYCGYTSESGIYYYIENFFFEGYTIKHYPSFKLRQRWSFHIYDMQKKKGYGAWFVRSLYRSGLKNWGEIMKFLNEDLLISFETLRAPRGFSFLVKGYSLDLIRLFKEKVLENIKILYNYRDKNNFSKEENKAYKNPFTDVFNLFKYKQKIRDKLLELETQNEEEAKVDFEEIYKIYKKGFIKSEVVKYFFGSYYYNPFDFFGVRETTFFYHNKLKEDRYFEKMYNKLKNFRYEDFDFRERAFKFKLEHTYYMYYNLFLDNIRLLKSYFVKREDDTWIFTISHKNFDFLGYNKNNIKKEEGDYFFFILLDFFFSHKMVDNVKEFYYTNIFDQIITYFNMYFFKVLFIFLFYLYVFVLFIFIIRLLYLLFLSLFCKILDYYNKYRNKYVYGYRTFENSYTFYEFYSNKFSESFNYKSRLSFKEFIYKFLKEWDRVLDIYLGKNYIFKEFIYKYVDKPRKDEALLYKKHLEKLLDISVNLNPNKNISNIKKYWLTSNNILYNKGSIIEDMYNDFSIMKAILPSLKTEYNSNTLKFIHRKFKYRRYHNILAGFTKINYPIIFRVLDFLLTQLRSREQFMDSSDIFHIWDHYNMYIFNEAHFRLILKDLMLKEEIDAKTNNILKDSKSFDDNTFNMLLYRNYSNFDISKKSWLFRYDSNLEILKLTSNNKSSSFYLNFYTRDWFRFRTNFFDLLTSKKRNTNLRKYFSNLDYHNFIIRFGYDDFLEVAKYCFFICCFLYFVIFNYVWYYFFIFVLVFYFFNKIFTIFFYESFFYNFLTSLVNFMYKGKWFFVLVSILGFTLTIALIIYVIYPLYLYFSFINIFQFNILEWFINEFVYFPFYFLFKLFSLENFAVELFNMSKFYLWISKFSVVYGLKFNYEVLFRKFWLLTEVLNEFYLNKYKYWYKLNLYDVFWPNYNDWFTFFKRPPYVNPFHFIIFPDMRKWRRDRARAKRASYWYGKFYEPIRNRLYNLDREITLNLIFDGIEFGYKRKLYISKLKVYNNYLYWHLSRLNNFIFGLSFYKSPFIFKILDRICWFFFFLKVNCVICDSIVYIYYFFIFIFILLFFVFFIFFYFSIIFLTTNKLIFYNFNFYHFFFRNKISFMAIEHNFFLKSFFTNFILKFALFNLKQKYKTISESKNIKYF